MFPEPPENHFTGQTKELFITRVVQRNAGPKSNDDQTNEEVLSTWAVMTHNFLVDLESKIKSYLVMWETDYHMRPDVYLVRGFNPFEKC